MTLMGNPNPTSPYPGEGGTNPQPGPVAEACAFERTSQTSKPGIPLMRSAATSLRHSSTEQACRLDCWPWGEQMHHCAEERCSSPGCLRSCSVPGSSVALQ